MDAPHHNEEQGTEDWLQDRCGKFTASEFWALVMKTKSNKYYSERDKIIKRVAFERITGRVGKEQFSSLATSHGKDLEPFNIAVYELQTGEQVFKTGFIKHPQYPFAGASPDGLVGETGGIEAKCPRDHTIHIDRLIDGMPPEMRWQCIGGIWVTNREWWDWTSYDPDMDAANPKLGLYIQRVTRDEQEISTLEAAVLEAEREVNELIKKLMTRAA